MPWCGSMIETGCDRRWAARSVFGCGRAIERRFQTTQLGTLGRPGRQRRGRAAWRVDCRNEAVKRASQPHPSSTIVLFNPSYYLAELRLKLATFGFAEGGRLHRLDTTAMLHITCSLESYHRRYPQPSVANYIDHLRAGHRTLRS